MQLWRYGRDKSVFVGTKPERRVKTNRRSLGHALADLKT